MGVSRGGDRKRDHATTQEIANSAQHSRRPATIFRLDIGAATGVHMHVVGAGGFGFFSSAG